MYRINYLNNKIFYKKTLFKSYGDFKLRKWMEEQLYKLLYEYKEFNFKLLGETIRNLENFEKNDDRILKEMFKFFVGVKTIPHVNKRDKGGEDFYIASEKYILVIYLDF